MSEDTFSEKIRTMVYPRNEIIDPMIATEKRKLFTEYLAYCFDVLGKVQFKWNGFPITVDLSEHKGDIVQELNKLDDNRVLAIWAKGKVLFDSH